MQGELPSLTVTPSRLRKREHGAIICYPGTDITSFDSRVTQLKKLGVQELVLEGSSKVGKYGIIGRGCVSTVVKARLKSEEKIVALKIRRVDANRVDMKHDYELQKFANSFGVGPVAISASKDLFAMEYVDSVRVGRWFQSLKTRSSKRYLQALIRDVLEQCFLLDLNGLDHGELSNPTKHVLILNSTDKPKTAIIDYESASLNRRVSNLTSVSQFFFLGGWQSAKVQKILGLTDPKSRFSKKKVISSLRIYKEKPNRTAFEKFSSLVGL